MAGEIPMTETETRIRLEKRLELRNIVWDKIIVGSIVAGAIFAGNLALEDYKISKEREMELLRDTRSQSQYLLQSRLAAIIDLREAYSKMNRDLYLLTFELPPGPDHDEARRTTIIAYRTDLAAFVDVFNKWGALFSNKLDLSLQYHTALHQALAFNQIPYSADYYGFMMGLYASFDELTRTSLREEVFGEPANPESDMFHPLPWKREQFVQQNAAESYFVENWKIWQNRNSAEVEATPIPTTPVESKADTKAR